MVLSSYEVDKGIIFKLRVEIQDLCLSSNEIDGLGLGFEIGSEPNPILRVWNRRKGP